MDNHERETDGRRHMNLNDLLQLQGIDPQQVLVLRHRPQEPKLNRVLPWLAAERPDVFNAYQRTHSIRLETTMQKLVGTGYVASFIGHEPGKALYVGLYTISSSLPLTYEEYRRVPENIELREEFGMKGYTEESGRNTILWFDLVVTDFYKNWKGKLVVEWPPLELAWWRRAHQNDIPILAILEDSALVPKMPNWYEIQFSWQELAVLPTKWKLALSQWRGIYYIFDTSDGRGYVGSAYGENNLLGRWLNYANSGDGGNQLLRQRDPQNFRFTILQRVSPDMDASEIVQLESSWKLRLHTREYGLNKN